MNIAKAETFYFNPQEPRVVITLLNTYTVCAKCHDSFPTELRRMAPGENEYRNQPRCPGCR